MRSLSAARALRASLALLGAAAALTGCGGGPADGDAVAQSAPTTPGPSTPVSSIDVTRQQDGMEVTLLRVERIGGGGRVFLRAHNGTDAPAAVLNREIVLTQGGERLRPSPDPVGRTPNFRVLEPGATSAAVQYYRVVEPGAARLEVDWISRDLDISPAPFAFTFRVR